jgi:hypothetical protein
MLHVTVVELCGGQGREEGHGQGGEPHFKYDELSRTM